MMEIKEIKQKEIKFQSVYISIFHLIIFSFDIYRHLQTHVIFINKIFTVFIKLLLLVLVG